MEKYNHQLRESWEKNAPAWTRSVREEKIESRNLVTNKAILDSIVELNPNKVLDLGCGEGWMTRQLSPLGIEVTGVDYSASLISEAKKSGETFHQLSFEEFSANPELVGKNYDVIAYNFSLLSEDLLPILNASKKVLKENGTIVIQTLHPFSSETYEDGWRVETFDQMGDDYEMSMPWYFRTVSSWYRTFKESDLDLVDIFEPVHPEKKQPMSFIFVLK
ncbi:SAM-dependent methyltransferase [Halalkalibacillus sediminis]|uniref:SAM-dependent methyltransferase n=1 Tax=Halalkalibacillus sediminis TaxID=2018042 RepID=A0A2I0QUI6_9BACI|nr:class I SAM-dependent methyltransferase [Halalkalibacillus sediminis]PKR77954.1 SAM-dependent methyltransferase [Halalkalibacillus sediminis]